MGCAHYALKLQLAHQERNEVSAAYNHATYLKERRVMMCDWANHLMNGAVVPMWIPAGAHRLREKR